MLMSAVRDAENDILALRFKRLESQSDPLTPASAALIAPVRLEGGVRRALNDCFFEVQPFFRRRRDLLGVCLTAG